MDFELIAKPLQLMGLAPSPREAHSMLARDANRILVFGGGCISPIFGPQQFNDLFLLDLKESTWSYIPNKGDPPSQRTGQSATLLPDGRVLVFGGSSMTAGYMNDVHLLDTKEWEWSTPDVTGKPPSPRDKHSACLCGNRLYIFGGFGPSVKHKCGDEDSEEDEGQAGSTSSANEEGSSDEEEEDDLSMSFTWFNDVHVLDLMSMQWEELHARGVKPTPRAAHAAFVTAIEDDGSGKRHEKMVVFGGRDPSGRQNDLFFLDLGAMEWSKVDAKAPPPPRSFHVMLPLGDSKMAVSYGGVAADGSFFPGLELLKLDTMEWANLSKCGGSWPPTRGPSAMVGCEHGEESKLVIFGGSRSSEETDIVYFNDVYAIDVTPLLKDTR